MTDQPSSSNTPRWPDRRQHYCPQCGSPLQDGIVDGRPRQSCAANCGYVFWDNPTPVVAGIVELDGQVVLVRSKGWPGRFFGSLSGFLESVETPEDAVLRELKEELGLEGEIVSYIGSYAFFEMNQIILAYHIQARGEIQIGEELEEIKRLPPERLRPWPLGTGLAVKDWLARRKTA